MQRTFISTITAIALPFFANAEQVRLPDGRMLNLAKDGTYEVINAERGIEISLLSAGEELDDFKKSPECVLTFSLVNNSFGTIRDLRFPVSVFDDRGRPLEVSGFPFLDIFGFNDGAVAVGGIHTFNIDIESPCGYVSRLSMGDINESACNIRNMPETAKCSDDITINSAVDGIAFSKSF